MRRYLAAIIAVLIMAPNAARAANAEGAGLRSCGQSAKDYQQSPLMAEDVYFAWTEGFLSGANQAVKSLSRPLRDLSGLPLDAQKAFIRGYCDQHPLAQYCDAVIELLDKAAREGARSVAR
jgi:hypothetical protein